MTTSPELSDVLQAAMRSGVAHNNGTGGQYLLCATESQLLKFAAVLADRASVADRGVQAVPGEPVDAEIWKELYQLREAVKGPKGFATWQDAAVDERHRRVKAEAALAASVASLAAPASPSVAQAEPVRAAGSMSKEARQVGALMANTMFNLAQQTHKFDDYHRNLFKSMQVKWDAAIRASAGEAQATLPSTPKAGGEQS